MSTLAATDLEAHIKNAMTHHRQGQLAQARAMYSDILVMQPEHPQVIHLMGVLALQNKDYGEAIDQIERAIALAPQLAAAHFESRWQRHNFTSEKRAFTAPLWLGQTSLVDQRILLHGEQGLGDLLQFCRYTSSSSSTVKPNNKTGKPCARASHTTCMPLKIAKALYDLKT